MELISTRDLCHKFPFRNLKLKILNINSDDNDNYYNNILNNKNSKNKSNI